MKIQNETDILDPVFRAKVLKEIVGNENVQRKNAAFKRYECFKDLSNTYVMQLLLNQFDQSTVMEMQYAVTNISFVRKIIDKLAKVYSNGVKRTAPKVKDTKAIEAAADHLKFNAKMKKTNRYLKLFKNTMVYVKPTPIEDKFDIKVVPLPPFLYDVIEHPNDEECPYVVILSSYQPTNTLMYSMNPATALRGVQPGVQQLMPHRGDNVDQIIADEPTDKPQNEFIWWSPTYHFTTNKKGEITSLGDGLNPIAELPFVNFAEDQDDAFWAKGGSDLVDAGVKINALLTNINHVAISQGYGQLYMSGKNLPTSIKVGPNHCIKLVHEEGEPEPKIGFLSANPPIGDLMRLIEMYVSLLLSTNNLSTSGFSATLNGSNAFASGIALLIDKSESVEDVEDQAKLFSDNEPEIWELVSKWHAVYKAPGLLVEELDQITMPQEIDLTVSFPAGQTLLTEQDKLDVIEKRMELGLNTEVELLMRDDPSLDEKSAEQKLMKIQAEKMQNMQTSMNMAASLSPMDGQPQVQLGQDQLGGKPFVGAPNVQGNKDSGAANKNNFNG